jgi:hypothetical protein
MIVWGGGVAGSPLNTGGRYCAQTGVPPSGWQIVALGDFDGDGKLDYVLSNASTWQTAIWYLNNNAFIRGVYGPPLPADWSLVAVGDFNAMANPIMSCSMP